MNPMYEKVTVKMPWWFWVNLCRCILKAQYQIDNTETSLKQCHYTCKMPDGTEKTTVYYVDKKTESNFWHIIDSIEKQANITLAVKEVLDYDERLKETRKKTVIAGDGKEFDAIEPVEIPF